MKNLKSIALALTMLFTATTIAQTKKVNVSKSTINWLAKKVTGEHSGTVNLKEGNLTFKSKKLTGGSFVVDMNSLTATDLQGEWQGKLNGHLKSDDFFGTEKFPTATLIFKKLSLKSKGIYTVTGDLTIKDKTNSVTFDLAVTQNTAKTKLVVDRTLYDIKYGSGSFFDNLGDKAIANEFELNVALQF
jgi:polyisoprenoid-binding protein YceI